VPRPWHGCLEPVTAMRETKGVHQPVLTVAIGVGPLLCGCGRLAPPVEIAHALRPWHEGVEPAAAMRETTDASSPVLTAGKRSVPSQLWGCVVAALETGVDLFWPGSLCRR